MTAANFARRLKELRVQAGLTQEVLAEQAGLSKGGVADLEQGRREPGWGTVIALAAALGVTCQDFMVPAGENENTKRGRPRGIPVQPDAATKPTDEAVSGSTAKKPNVRAKKARKAGG